MADTQRVQTITEADRRMAVSRALAAAAARVRITQGQRQAIVASAKRRSV